MADDKIFAFSQSYVSKKELISFAESLLSLEPLLVITDSIINEVFNDLKVAYVKLTIGGNYNTKSITAQITQTESNNNDYYDTFVAAVNLASLMHGKPGVKKLGKAGMDMIKHFGGRSECTNQRARQGLTSSLAAAFEKRFTKPEIKLMGITDYLDDMKTASEAFNTALEARDKFKTEYEKNAYNESRAGFIKLWTEFRDLTNRFIERYGARVIGEEFVRKLSQSSYDLGMLTRQRAASNQKMTEE